MARFDNRNRQEAANNPFLQALQQGTISRKDLESLRDTVKATPDESTVPSTGTAIGQGIAEIPDILLQASGQGVGGARGGTGLDEKIQAELLKQEFILDPREKAKEAAEQTRFERGEKNKLLNQATKLGLQLDVSSDASIEEIRSDLSTKISQQTAEKKSASQEKREVELTQLNTGLTTLLGSFDRAVASAEAAKIPLFGAAGPPGRVGGFLAGATARIGALPEVKVFVDQRKAFATTVAKAAGEVRPTDEDIQRFVETLPDPTTKTAEENAIIVQDIKNKISNGNVEELWRGGASTQPVARTPVAAGQQTAQDITPEQARAELQRRGEL